MRDVLCGMHSDGSASKVRLPVLGGSGPLLAGTINEELVMII